jgi:hypothetical protein
MASPFVTWPDAATAHSKKSIDVVVRIDFILRDEATGALQDFRRAELPNAIKAVEARWSGHKFKCYDFNVKIDWKIVADRDSVRANALDVVLWEGLPGYATTICDGPDEEKSMSDDPADALVPKRGGFWNETIWDLGVAKMAHEVGHVLGLGEGYTGEGTATTPIPGHPADIMANPNNPVLPSTITRLVRRHYGPSFEKAMKCPLGLRFGPSRFDLLLASLDDIRLDAKAPRYDPPTADPEAPPEPTKFEGEFNAAGEYLTRFELPWAASGQATRPVKFQLDLGQEPIDVRIDLGFWVLTQKARWDPESNLPYAAGPFTIEVEGGKLDSSMLFPGPPLMPEFYDPDAEA